MHALLLSSAALPHTLLNASAAWSDHCTQRMEAQHMAAQHIARRPLTGDWVWLILVGLQLLEDVGSGMQGARPAPGVLMCPSSAATGGFGSCLAQPPHVEHSLQIAALDNAQRSLPPVLSSTPAARTTFAGFASQYANTQPTMPRPAPAQPCPSLTTTADRSPDEA